MSVAGSNQRNLAQSLLQQALDQSAEQVRYELRLKKYPTVTGLGLLPHNLDDILYDKGPSLFHSLAFRMATYDSESLFERLEQLLSRVEAAEGWSNEYKNWSSNNAHWAISWDKLNQFLWLLQCYEYFADRCVSVEFPYSKKNPKPDILAKFGDGSHLYAECYHYTKWWGAEQLIEHVLYALNENLRIKRTFNITRGRKENNPLSDAGGDKISSFLASLSLYLTPDKLAELRRQASVNSPVEICRLGDFNILLEGSGEYVPRRNAHGDANYSLPTFIKEILANKSKSNGMSDHTPNVLLINCLSLDYQFSLKEFAMGVDLPQSINEAWFCACGIDGKLETCRRLRAVRESPSDND